MLTVAIDEYTISRRQVQLRCNRFKEVREDVNADARHGRPNTSTTDENIEAMKKMISDVLGMKRATAKIAKFSMRLSGDVDDVQDLRKGIITGDESWVSGYDIETKVQSSQWKAFCYNCFWPKTKP